MAEDAFHLPDGATLFCIILYANYVVMLRIVSAKNGEDPTSTSEVISLSAWPRLIWPTLY